MKNYNGYGGISKLSGKRRKPYWVRLTTGWEINEETGKAKQLYKTLGYFPTRREAMLALAAYHTNPMDLTNKDITFREVYEIWSEKHFERFPKTRGTLAPSYKKCEPLHNMKMVDIKTAHCQNVLDKYSTMSESAQINIKTVMSKSFEYCLENDIVQKNYASFAKTTPKPAKVDDKFFTKKELEHLFNNLDYVVSFPRGQKERFDMNMTDSILILLYSGLRIGELLAIKTEDVNLNEGWIQVNGTKTKSANRILPIHKEIIEIVKRNMFGEYLISYPDGKPIQYQNYLRRFYDKFMAFLGFDDLTPHATRHTFVTAANKSGVNPLILKRIVGHSNSSVTEHYTHTEIDDLIAEINKVCL